MGVSDTTNVRVQHNRAALVRHGAVFRGIIDEGRTVELTRVE